MEEMEKNSVVIFCNFVFNQLSFKKHDCSLCCSTTNVTFKLNPDLKNEELTPKPYVSSIKKVLHLNRALPLISEIPSCQG